MRISDNGHAVTLWASARDTYDWAWKPGEHWPCSTLAGRRLRAEFDPNGLCDLTVNGKDAGEVDSHELNAICSDLLADRLPTDHPVYFVAVGQFLGGSS